MRLAAKLAETKNHPAISIHRETAYNKLIHQCEAILVNGEDEGFKNNNDTLVVALADCSDASRSENSQIHEWIDDYTDLLMEAIAELKPDEFEIKPLKGLPGYNRIVRMWWD
mgnify:CR=1 FL=1